VCVQDTRDACDLMVKFETLNPVVVKGREAPLNVFRALSVHSNGDIRRNVLSLVKQHQKVNMLPPALENYFFGAHFSKVYSLVVLCYIYTANSVAC